MTSCKDFLKTKKGLEYLLETSPSDMLVITAINKAVTDFEYAENNYQKQLEDDRRNCDIPDSIWSET